MPEAARNKSRLYLQKKKHIKNLQFLGTDGRCVCGITILTVDPVDIAWQRINWCRHLVYKFEEKCIVASLIATVNLGGLYIQCWNLLWLFLLTVGHRVRFDRTMWWWEKNVTEKPTKAQNWEFVEESVVTYHAVCCRNFLDSWHIWFVIVVFCFVSILLISESRKRGHFLRHHPSRRGA